MKWFEWMIALSFIGLGLLCLALSAQPGWHIDTVAFFGIVFQVCFWMCIPFVLLGFLLLAFLFAKKRK
ncbi:hypothetical protein [Caenibacillus caldisaponilyticus]|uniref:hypothetical protein n=1 Tax=Caenibacillus caldisaponilyticus TaxID=1674942 RepID=UPI0009887BAC|nr:hypothetical protein [Caenibacillus caldisaponilyticus]